MRTGYYPQWNEEYFLFMDIKDGLYQGVDLSGSILLAILDESCESAGMFTYSIRDTGLSVFHKDANRLEPRPSPTYVGPNLGSSLLVSNTTVFPIYC